MTQTTAELIDDIGGGTNAVAEALGVDPVVVRMWKHRKLIPRTAWPELQKTFPKLTLDVLMAAEQLAPPKPAKVAEPARASA